MTTVEAAPLLWINGFPGTGKLTVATAITELHKSAVVLDNHKLIDPVEAKFPRTHPDYQRERKLYRQKIFDEFVCNTEMLSKLVVFTDFQSTNTLGQAVAVEYLEAARRANRPFVPVYLTCDAQTNVDRVASLNRINSGTGKLTNVEILKTLHANYEIFRFNSSPGLTIDSTNTTPQEAAAKILAFLTHLANIPCVETPDKESSLPCDSSALRKLQLSEGPDA